MLAVSKYKHGSSRVEWKDCGDISRREWGCEVSTGLEIYSWEAAGNALGDFEDVIKRFSIRALCPGSIQGLLYEELESLLNTDMPSNSHDDIPKQYHPNVMSS